MNQKTEKFNPTEFPRINSPEVFEATKKRMDEQRAYIVKTCSCYRDIIERSNAAKLPEEISAYMSNFDCTSKHLNYLLHLLCFNVQVPASFDIDDFMTSMKEEW